MNIIDAQGQICPKPLIMTRKAIKDAKEGEVFSVLIDNETSKENVERFLEENKVSFFTTQKDNVFSIKVVIGNQELLNDDAESFCPMTASKTSGDLIIINKESIGIGPKELTEKLILGFFTTISEADSSPYGIVFYNSGVKLALKDSPILAELKKIKEKGTQILVCGTCIDYYKAHEQVGIGTISNMYDILSLMEKASKVFTP